MAFTASFTSASTTPTATNKADQTAAHGLNQRLPTRQRIRGKQSPRCPGGGHRDARVRSFAMNDQQARPLTAILATPMATCRQPDGHLVGPRELSELSTPCAPSGSAYWVAVGVVEAAR